MYSVADALLRWDEISLQRHLFKKATYTVYTLYTLCTERLNRDMGTARRKRMFFSATACLMSKVKNINQLHVKYEQAEWKIKN